MTGRLGMLTHRIRKFSTTMVRQGGGHGRPGCPGEVCSNFDTKVQN